MGRYLSEPAPTGSRPFFLPAANSMLNVALTLLPRLLRMVMRKAAIFCKMRGFRARSGRIRRSGPADIAGSWANLSLFSGRRG